MNKLTDIQLHRLYCRIYDRIPYGGHFGWDWPTLRMCYPAIASALKACIDESRRRVFATCPWEQGGGI